MTNKVEIHEVKVQAPRPLPVIALLDVSGSMDADGKIQALNGAMGEMLASFAAEEDARTEIHLVVVTFGEQGARVHQEPTPATKCQWQPLAAKGGTPLGAALDVVRELLEDKNRIPGRSYRPTLVLVSDGQPTDEWKQPLDRLLKSERAAKAVRFAMGIGADADKSMLQAFIADPEKRVFEAHEARKIKQFFQWVTMSVTARTRSVNPNGLLAIERTPPEEIEF